MPRANILPIWVTERGKAGMVRRTQKRQQFSAGSQRPTSQSDYGAGIRAFCTFLHLSMPQLPRVKSCWRMWLGGAVSSSLHLSKGAKCSGLHPKNSRFPGLSYNQRRSKKNIRISLRKCRRTGTAMKQRSGDSI